MVLYGQYARPQRIGLRREILTPERSIGSGLNKGLRESDPLMREGEGPPSEKVWLPATANAG